MPTLAHLPRIVRFDEEIDYGPCDDGATAVCPHCGSDGRYVQYFLCDDGNSYGAMRGCVKLFPVAPIAKRHQKLAQRKTELRRKYGKDATLNSWDARQMDAIERCYAGEIDEAEAFRIINREEAAKAAWRNKKYSPRS
jgi:hypothetical protein